MDFDKLLATLRVEEGFSADPYPDGCGWSVGYGHWSKGKPEPVTKDIADKMLHTDASTVSARLQGFPCWYDVERNDARERALTEMCFNLGFAGLQKFKRMLDAIKRQDFHSAAIEIMDSKAAEMLPKRYARIAVMMKTGEDVA